MNGIVVAIPVVVGKIGADGENTMSISGIAVKLKADIYNKKFILTLS